MYALLTRALYSLKFNLTTYILNSARFIITALWFIRALFGIFDFSLFRSLANTFIYFQLIIFCRLFILNPASVKDHLDHISGEIKSFIPQIYFKDMQDYVTTHQYSGNSQHLRHSMCLIHRIT